MEGALFREKTMKKQGFFISLEGGEGCGKSTQLNLLAQALQKMDPRREIIATRSPGGTPAAERIRAVLKERIESEDIMPETELLLFGACHSQMVRTLITPAMERGAILITDRFFDSTIVYQGIARKLGRALIDEINTIACGSVKPDLTILLDIPTDVSFSRTHIRDGNAVESDRFDSEGEAFHAAIRQGFLDLAAEEKERFVVVDATGDVNEVHQQIWEVVRGRLA